MGSHSTHPHSHSHAPGQAHSHRHDTNERRMELAALLTGLFMGAEIAGGIVSGSLALLADAGHMLTDFASLSLAWFGFVWRGDRRTGYEPTASTASRC